MLKGISAGVVVLLGLVAYLLLSKRSPLAQPATTVSHGTTTVSPAAGNTAAGIIAAGSAGLSSIIDAFTGSEE